MATKKTTTEKKDVEVVETAKVIMAPRVTEKASMQSSANAYTFVVRKDATKHTVLNAFKKEYKVTPKAINITNMPRKNTFIRGKFGTKAGIKKAIVFLKKGDTITLS
ncbi:50S ribosomal protein L23 [Candidatus Gracilibacteria bacterium]|nr:50S ribosomal protein L23 [Candidatus Gracilibacteria bacterium]MCF7898471.1 50S ribosomal protein L23 [Candidatus Paceibacterota bacterium]